MQIALRGWIGFVEATSLSWVASQAVSRDDLVALLSAMLFDAVTRASVVAP